MTSRKPRFPSETSTSPRDPDPGGCHISDSPVILALDSSTTAAKATAFDLDGHAVAEARRDYPRNTPRPGWQGQDTTDWWRAAAEAIREVTGKLEGSGREILSLRMTHQREPFVLLDEHDAPIRPAVLWLDTRAADQITRFDSDQIHTLPGKPPSTTPSLYKLIWLAGHEPQMIRTARRVVEVHAYLTHELTGQWATSWAIAGPMAVLGMSSFEYSEELLTLAGLGLDQMAKLRPPDSVMATVTDDVVDSLGLPRDLPAVAGAGDDQSAGLGANITTASRAYLSLGISMTMGIHSEQYLYSRAFHTLSSPIASSYTLEALLSSGGLCTTWFRDRLLRMDPADEPIESCLEELAAGVPAGARGMRFLPYLTNAETPYWDVNARGPFVGFSDTYGVPELCRALLEGLALEERVSLKRVEKATGMPVERLVVMGGEMKSPLFNQILADTLQRLIDVCAETETTCLGTATLGATAVGVGGATDMKETAARMSRVSHTVAPQPHLKKFYKKAAKACVALYPALRKVFPVIAELHEKAS